MMGLKIFMLAAGILAATGGAAFADGLLTGWSNADGSGVETEFGVRTWLGSSNGGKSLFAADDKSLMLSRLTYGNMPIASGEVFGEVTTNDFFVSGFAALGVMPGGKLQDEDFPPGTDPYSGTESDQHGGALRYATIDVGRNFIDAGGIRAGAFIGYNYLGQDTKAFGCTQMESNTDICTPTIDASIDTIDQSNAWQSLRLGVSGQANFDNRLSITGDAAVLPFVSLSGSDTHLLQIPAEFSGPVPEDGKGWGVQLQAMLDYQVNDQFSVGVGGRYWHMETHGSAHFEDVGNGVPQPLDWQTNVFGLLTEVKAHF